MALLCSYALLALPGCALSSGTAVTGHAGSDAYPAMRHDVPAPGIDFSGVQADLAGPPTRILVLGSHHLSSLPEDRFHPSDLSILLARLQDFAPDIIAIEAIGGRGCEQLRRYPDLFPRVADQYCVDTASLAGVSEARAIQAASEAESLLRDSPAERTPALRRQLAGVLFAAGEPWSAALQWSYLPQEERVADEHISPAVRHWLDKALLSRNENNLLGVALAQKLGLQSLAAMDDHSADIVQTRFDPEVEAAVMQAWKDAAARRQGAGNEAENAMDSPESVLANYRLINSEAHQRQVIARDFGAAASSSLHNNAARQYLAWWQVRGLRMAANVLEAAANQPGARVLVIVGASHKSYFEAYLDQMHDVELVDVASILR